MRITKEMLEDENRYYRAKLLEKDKEIARLAQLVTAYKGPHNHLAAFAVATERVTEALAHIIADLKKGDKK